MKIAITATGNTLDSTVDPRFGRAAWFLIVDTDTKQLIEAIDNTAGKEAAHGAGISAAAQVADKGVEALLTGRVGPKALPVLEKAGVKAVNNVSGSILDAIDQYTVTRSAPQQETNQGSAQAPSQNAGQSQGQGRGQGCGCGNGQGQGKGMGQGKGQGRGQCRR
ncbi:MAG TPA: dinitrogenase iron-molybdenum cofactor biosynthesis protein [Desulfobacterales bacterium]|nr:dinitrogenase iron-molybdenum cofactor biosynthesis protein [Desulfobacterales bacterium]